MTYSNDVVAGEVQLMFDEAQESIIDRIYGDVAALERQGIKPPRIDGLPSRPQRAEAKALTETVRLMEAEEMKKAEEFMERGSDWR